MSTITPVEPTHRLWQVTDFLPPTQAADVLATDWLNMPWRRGYMQEHWHRRAIDIDHPIIQRLNSYVHDQIPRLNQQFGTNYVRGLGLWWLDEPGFTVDIHTDGHLNNSLQLSWIAPDDSYGTRFYSDKAGKQLIYQALGRANTGYIMLNHLNEDGSQPLHWHGMPKPVPENTFRLCNYWQFEED